MKEENKNDELISNLEKLLKKLHPSIEFGNKWDYLKQRFSADDMIRFAELYVKTKDIGDDNKKREINMGKNNYTITKRGFRLPDYMETLSEELNMNGFCTSVKQEGYKMYIELDTMAGTMKYQKAFNDIMKDYYRFIWIFGYKIAGWALKQQHLA
jgi:hypothetical protein